MTDAVDGMRPAAERLDPAELPGLAQFLAGSWLRDPETARGSAQRAAWEFAAEAELDELEELAHDWQVLQVAAREMPLAELNRLLRERFGSSWQAGSRDEVEAVGAELERALRE